MDDEHTPHDLDRRVRGALAIDDAASRRVVARALKAPDERPPHRDRVKSAAALAVGVAVVAGISVWRPWRDAPAPAPSPPALRITAKGAVLVVESQDGRRWIVGPPPARPTGGNYVLVVPQ